MSARVEYAPPASQGKRNVIEFVRIMPGEKVSWHWTHTHEGSFISGYSIARPSENFHSLVWQMRFAPSGNSLAN
jgi:hypothetical protein